MPIHAPRSILQAATSPGGTMGSSGKSANPRGPLASSNSFYKRISQIAFSPPSSSSSTTAQSTTSSSLSKAADFDDHSSDVIGAPFNVKHHNHVEPDPKSSTGFKGLPDSWKKILSESGKILLG
jgi:hypothetical protein